MHELQRSRRIVDAMSWLDMAGGRLFDKLTQRRISEASVTRLKETLAQREATSSGVRDG